MNECSHSKRPVWRQKTRLTSPEVCLQRFQRFDVIKAERLFTPPHSWRQVKGGSAGRVFQALYIWPPKETILLHIMAAFVSFYINNSFRTTLNDAFMGKTAKSGWKNIRKQPKLNYVCEAGYLLYGLRSRPLELMGARKNWALEGDINRYIYTEDKNVQHFVCA